MNRIVRYKVLIAGSVQGVGFRYFVFERAQSLGVTGWVRNLRDGRVEAEIEGDRDAVNQLLDSMREGPTFAHVQNVSTFPLGAGKQFNDFRVTADGQ
jgi:acylphosphatase